jgi:hypothetical protein
MKKKSVIKNHVALSLETDAGSTVQDLVDTVKICTTDLIRILKLSIFIILIGKIGPLPLTRH